MAGQQIDVGQGSIVWHPADADALHGLEASVEQGTLTFRQQGGQQINTGQGSVSVDTPQPSLSGEELSFGQGTLTASGNDVTVHISGSEAEFRTGTVTIGPAALSGGEIAAEDDGTVTPSVSLAITGIEATVSADTIVPNIEADDTRIISQSGSGAVSFSTPLVGTAVAVSTGSLNATDRPLEGSEVTVEQGTPPPVVSAELTGSEILVEQESVGAPGGASLSGQEVVLSSGVISRSPVLTGQSVTVDLGTIVGVPGVVALVGQSVSVGQGEMESSGIGWERPPEPSTTWTPTSNPNSAWVRKGGPSTSWNRND